MACVGHAHQQEKREHALKEYFGHRARGAQATTRTETAPSMTISNIVKAHTNCYAKVRKELQDLQELMNNLPEQKDNYTKYWDIKNLDKKMQLIEPLIPMLALLPQEEREAASVTARCAGLKIYNYSQRDTEEGRLERKKEIQSNKCSKLPLHKAGSSTSQ